MSCWVVPLHFLFVTLCHLQLLLLDVTYGLLLLIVHFSFVYPYCDYNDDFIWGYHICSCCEENTHYRISIMSINVSNLYISLWHCTTILCPKLYHYLTLISPRCGVIAHQPLHFYFRNIKDDQKVMKSVTFYIVGWKWDNNIVCYITLLGNIISRKRFVTYQLFLPKGTPSSWCFYLMVIKIDFVTFIHIIDKLIVKGIEYWNKWSYVSLCVIRGANRPIQWVAPLPYP